MKRIMVFFTLALALSLTALAQSQAVMPMSKVMQKALGLGYHSFFEVELEQGVYKFEALDSHQQEVDLVFDAVTGQLVPATEQMPKRNAFDVANSLEKQGVQVVKIDLEESGYYKVKFINSLGQKQEMKIPANDDSPIKVSAG